MQLAYSTWMDVEAYLKRSKGVIIPIGSTEQHGPTGPIGTDAICAEVIARHLGDAVGGLVTPTISVGMSVHHTAFPGSLTLRPSTLMRVIEDYVMCLAGYGLERFFFVNGHGGNEASLAAAFWEMWAKAPLSALAGADRLRFMSISWWTPEPVAKLKHELFGDKDGGHATPAEISVAMFACPDQNWITASLPQGVAPVVAGRRLGQGQAGFQRDWPDGRIQSDPTLARPEHGKRLVEACVESMSATYKAFMEAK